MCEEELNFRELNFGAVLKKLYCTTIRPTVFKNSMSQKATYYCPVKRGGLCRHTLRLLLFSKYYPDTKERMLELTCNKHLSK